MIPQAISVFDGRLTTNDLESRRVCELRASSSGSARRFIASDIGRPVFFRRRPRYYDGVCIIGFRLLAFPVRTSLLGARSRLGWGSD